MFDWHSLICRNGQVVVQLFFPLMFTFGDKLSQVPPVPKDQGVMPPPRRNASPPHVATVYNKHTGGGGAGVSPSNHTSLPGLYASFMHVWSFVCLFWHLLLPPS
jgi:hypothetical protein